MIWYKDYVILWIIFRVFALITATVIIPMSYVVGYKEGIEVGKKYTLKQ